MDTINREDAGWLVALAWLSGLEETARDFHGTRPRVFTERAYEHTVLCYLHLLGDEYGMQINKSDSIRSAVRELYPDRHRRGSVPECQSFRAPRCQSIAS